MTDEFDDLKAALRKEGPVAPAKAARDLAIEKAMHAFDEKKSAARQGIAIGDRLKGTAIAVYETLIGRRSMNMKLTPALAGGASLSAILLVIMSTNYLQDNFEEARNFPDGLASQHPTPSPRSQDLEEGALSDNVGKVAKVDNRLARESELVFADPGLPISSSDGASTLGGAGAIAPSLAPMPSVAYEVAPPPGLAQLPAPSTAKHRYIAASDDADRHSLGYYQDQGRDEFSTIETNPIKLVSEEPVSTFSIDVDTASYAFIRASLNNNFLPQKDAVRVEELINYFPYDYASPTDASVPFKAGISVYPAPWAEDKNLIHIGIKGYELAGIEKPASNLVFLLDTSGSMDAPNKLPLVRNAMKLLLDGLKPDDTISIVTYAGSAGTVLEPTEVKDKAKIFRALDNLHSGGSTAGAEGIRQAYQLAEQNFRDKGVNRIILATDGDFNVGISNDEELKSYIERKRDTGIYLSVLGFGRGNYNDALMQTLAQNGNGNAAYIDNLNEARKVLVEEAGSTLFTIARDVKIQVEFNPETISEYRLIGYETRLLNREDFNNDKVDAGDIGSGHTVTAIYEVTPAGSDARMIDDLRYGTADTAAQPSTTNNEYGFLKMRYKLPGETTSKLVTTAITPDMEYATIAAAPREARFATAVAGFGQLLRDGRYTGDYGHDDVIDLAQSAKGEDEFGYRAEFINLVRLSKSVAAIAPLEADYPASAPVRP
jgi:Ca-activated chloride channel homolog